MKDIFQQIAVILIDAFSVVVFFFSLLLLLLLFLAERVLKKTKLDKVRKSISQMRFVFQVKICSAALTVDELKARLCQL